MTDTDPTPLIYSVRHTDGDAGTDTARVRAHHFRQTDDFIEFVDAGERVMLAVPTSRVVFIRLSDNPGA